MKKRTVFAWTAVVAVAGLGVWGWSRGSTPPPAPIEETTVESRSVDDIIEVAGHLRAQQEQEIRSPVSGTVTQVYVGTNAPVVPGTTIATLDSLEQEQSLADLSYQVDQERFAGNLRKLALLEGKAEVQRRIVDGMTIRAYLRGKVSRLDLKVGDVLKAGEPYGRIIDIEALVADVEIPELDIPRIRKGQEVEFRFPALPGLVLAGRVESFPAEARVNTRGLTVLDARLRIDSPPEQLLPAYSFQAVLKVGAPRKILVVDSRAVTYLAGKPQVERKTSSGTWETVAVETEGFGSGLVRLVAGAAADDVLRITSAPGVP